MNHITFRWAIAGVLSLLLASCGAVGTPTTPTSSRVEVPQSTPSPMPTVTPPADGGTSNQQSLQTTFETIYQQVNPSVVNIHVVDGASSNSQGSIPFFSPPSQGVQSALGSGFVWDENGDIVTNHHVIAGATDIEVTFSDGTTVPGKVVGSDPDSDLAVVKVNVPARDLKPVSMGDSSLVKVGQIAMAIGNPYGLQGSMTEGIISALGRMLPVSNTSNSGANYTIPDVVQTDASINPGNSGGVLLNAAGQVIGVTSAIISPDQASAGIGFAIPAAIVEQVVPSLISTGHYEHPYIGIEGTTLTPDMATAMNLSASQRGALVINVQAGSPAGKAGLKGGNKQATIAGLQVEVGGDVITGVDGTPVNSFDDLVTYLARNTQVGQTINLTVLRNGAQMTVKLTLAARPTGSQAQATP